MSESGDRIRAVFEGWSLYEKIIHFDYMKHRQISSSLRKHLQNRFDAPVRVIDVGCGDGWFANSVLDGMDVVSYVGMDLSESALAAARPRLSGLSEDLTLIHADVGSHQFSTEVNCDLILASYSLHHFREPALAQILKSLRQLLSLQGCLVWVETVRRPDETRAEYLTRLCDDLVATWQKCDEAELKTVRDHVWSDDYPVSVEEAAALADAAGFLKPEPVYEDDFFTAWVISAG